VGPHPRPPRVTALPGQLFKGKFYYCEGTDTRNISTKAECRAAHYRWVRRKYNFDNLGQVGTWGGPQGLVWPQPHCPVGDPPPRPNPLSCRH
jgi:hypothetical protein